MNTDCHATGRALGREAERRIGELRLDLATNRWWWSPETFRIYGFEPGEVVPTSELLLAHVHPDDRDRARSAFEEACRTGEASWSLHRIADAAGRERWVVVAGQGRRDGDAGMVRELVGYAIDVTRAVMAEARALARQDVDAAARTRGPIEQAKGVVAGALGIHPDAAFHRLKRCSNDRNVPVRDLAALVVDEAAHGRGSAEHLTMLLRPSGAHAA